MNLYRPAHQWQGNPADSGGTGWYDCGPHSYAMGIDALTHGTVVPTGRDIRALTNEPAPQQSDPGVNHAQIIAAGERFGARFVTARRPWSEYLAKLRAHRWTCLSVWYADMGAFCLQKPNNAFGHDIGVMAIDTPGLKSLVYDPLGHAPRWIPLAVLKTAAEHWGSMNGLGGVDFIASIDPIPYE